MANTKFASEERSGKEELLAVLKDLKQDDYVQQLMDALPYLGAILNSNRQVVYANKALLELLGIHIVEALVGARPGEILGCVHSSEEIGGCGTSESCKHCGAVNSILKCQQSGQRATEELRLHSVINNENIAFDFKVVSSPFFFKNEKYVIFSLIDISNEKRRKILERIFFHDIFNKIHGLTGLTKLLQEARQSDKVTELIDILEVVGHSINHELVSHQQLMMAENGELEIVLDDIHSMTVLSETLEIANLLDIARGKRILVDESSEDVLLRTDKSILERILMNMVKNALESSYSLENVRTGCKMEGNNIVFWVNNSYCIPEPVQRQIFKRSFSTKQKDRGLGTYSMKLLGENYLKGAVYFTSTITEGTTFYFSLPKV